MAKKKRRLAVVFALVLAFSAVLGLNLGMREVRAAGESFSVSSIDDADFHGCKFQYSADRTNWSDITGTMSATNAAFLRITLAEGYQVAGHTAVRLNGTDVLQSNLDAFESNEGYALTGTEEYQIEHIQFTSSNPGGNDPGQGNNQGNNGNQSNNTQVDAITFSIGGQSYTISDMSNPTVRVDADSIANLEFAITSVTLNGTPYTLSGVGNGQYATAQDAEHRSVLQIMTIQGGENTGSQWSVGLQYHGNDDEEVNGRDTVNTTVPSFYIPQVIFTSNTQKGVQVTSSTQPDMYDPTVYPAQVDISQSSRENPARTAVYYDSSDFSISEVNGTAVSAIAVTDGGTAGAVTITGNTVTFNSGYYTSIPLTVTLADGTVGYMQVDRLGIELRETRSDGGILYHGSQAGSNMATVAGAGTYNIAAVFYYDAAKDYTDYDMVANLTYSNGTTETRVVGGFAQTVCNTPTLKGGEYLIWSGESVDAMPASVSVTAVKHGAASGSSFGGALFGAGKGVTKNFK